MDIFTTEVEKQTKNKIQLFDICPLYFIMHPLKKQVFRLFFTFHDRAQQGAQRRQTAVPQAGMPAESRGSKGREGGRGECAFRKGAGGVGT